MTSFLLLDHELELPSGTITSHAAFREWARSDEFPQTGRIDFIDGQVEIDMAPENIHFHASPKTEIVRMLQTRVHEMDQGSAYTDRTLVSCPDVGLSSEPDVVFLSDEAVTSGRVQLIPAADQKQDSYIELEGPPDLVVEIVSDSSVTKDTVRLFKQYYDAGVLEYWLVDARGEELKFDIHVRGEESFVPTARNSDGFQRAPVLDAAYQLTRRRNAIGGWRYHLVQQD